EGLHLKDGEHVLVADDPAGFAAAVCRLLEADDVWHRLASQGRAHIAALHGRDAARACLLKFITDVLGRSVKRVALPAPGDKVGPDAYKELVRRVREVSRRVLPREARVLVV